MNKMDLLNEAFVLLTQYHLMCFTRFVLDFESKVFVGFSLIAATCLNITINLGYITIVNVGSLAFKLKIMYHAYKSRQRIEERNRVAARKRKLILEKKLQLVIEYE